MSRLNNAWVLAAVGLSVVAGTAWTRSASSQPKTGAGAKETAGSLDVTGSFSISGAGADGKQYTGKADIAKIGGEMYKGNWVIGKTNFQSVCFRDDDILSCGWSGKHDLGVVAYLVKPDNSLDGVWFEEQNTSLGKEFLVGGNNNLLGVYSIKTGETPSHKKYNGTVEIAFEAGIYKLKWKTGKGAMEGLGLRNGDVLTAAFNDSGDFGVLQYRIKNGGKVLTGQWAQTKSSTPGPGIETLTKK
jgi:hypothetical protein